MKINRMISIFIFALMGVTACSTSSPERQYIKTEGAGHYKGMPAVTPLGPYNAIKAEGEFDIRITTNSKPHGMLLEGSQAGVDELSYFVEGKTLYITDDSYHHRSRYGSLEHAPVVPKVTVNLFVGADQLSSIDYTGNGDVTGTGIKSPRLNVAIDGNSTTNLTGDMGLQKVDAFGASAVNITGVKAKFLNVNVGQSSTVRITGVMNLKTLRFSGAGWLNMYWLDSPYLTVLGKDMGYAQLAGVAGTIEAHLYDNSHLDARYLRAEKGYIKTNQRATADMWVKQSLNSVAKGQSNIYYYRAPDHEGPYMRENGAIMSMVALKKF